MIDELKKMLKEDKEYFHSWQANIAVCFQDQCAKVKRDKKYLNTSDIHEISNISAKNFLNMLCLQGSENNK